MSDTNYIFEKLRSTCTQETLDKIENLMKNQNLKCNTTKPSKELHITNEEKARELFQSIPQCPYHIQYDETIENFTSIQLCELLEEMAKWKDEQLNEIVQKAWELFQQYATYMHPRKDIEMCVMNKQQFLKAIGYND